MGTSGLQDQFFQIISERFPTKGMMVDDITRILGFSKDAAYRRIRLQSILSPEEFKTLALHYKISIDRLVFGKTNNVLFEFNAFNKTVKSFDDYFGEILESMNKVKLVPEVRVHYSSSEIPLFYYCLFPELISFKLYVWGRAVWDMSHTQDAPFTFNMIPPSSLGKAAECLKLYMQLPTLQMWSMNIFDNTLNQIEYHLTSGRFKHKEDAILLLDKLEILCEHMRTMAVCGHKRMINSSTNQATLEIYHNEMIYTNNSILVLSPYFKGVFTTFGNPNYLFSNDERVIAYTTKWFASVLDKSTPISLGNEKSRNWFFDHLQLKVHDVRERLKNFKY